MVKEDGRRDGRKFMMKFWIKIALNSYYKLQLSYESDLEYAEVYVKRPFQIIAELCTYFNSNGLKGYWEHLLVLCVESNRKLIS